MQRERRTLKGFRTAIKSGEIIWNYLPSSRAILERWLKKMAHEKEQTNAPPHKPKPIPVSKEPKEKRTWRRSRTVTRASQNLQIFNERRRLASSQDNLKIEGDENEKTT